MKTNKKEKIIGAIFLITCCIVGGVLGFAYADNGFKFDFNIDILKCIAIPTISIITIFSLGSIIYSLFILRKFNPILKKEILDDEDYDFIDSYNKQLTIVSCLSQVLFALLVINFAIIANINLDDSEILSFDAPLSLIVTGAVVIISALYVNAKILKISGKMDKSKDISILDMHSGEKIFKAMDEVELKVMHEASVITVKFLVTTLLILSVLFMFANNIALTITIALLFGSAMIVLSVSSYKIEKKYKDVNIQD